MGVVSMRTLLKQLTISTMNIVERSIGNYLPLVSPWVLTGLAWLYAKTEEGYQTRSLPVHACNAPPKSGNPTTILRVHGVVSLTGLLA